VAILPVRFLGKLLALSALTGIVACNNLPDGRDKEADTVIECLVTGAEDLDSVTVLIAQDGVHKDGQGSLDLASVVFDGREVPMGSSALGGAHYELRFPRSGFAGPHTITLKE
jgi:hypothetical protein